MAQHNLIQINVSAFGEGEVWLKGTEMIDSAKELLQACRSARLVGSDFPTIWQQILKRHPFVLGMPIQRTNDETPTLEVPLINGQRLIFGLKEISLG